MARSPKPRSKSSRRSARAAASEPAPVQSVPRPGGKLGVIIERLAAKTGATADELVEATGWQRHSVLGALSRLRSRGFAMQLDAHADRKAYRLDNAAKAVSIASEGRAMSDPDSSETAAPIVDVRKRADIEALAAELADLTETTPLTCERNGGDCTGPIRPRSSAETCWNSASPGNSRSACWVG